MSGLIETPAQAVQDGRPRYGRFRTSFPDLNLLDARWGPPGRGLRSFRLKEWEHIALIHPDWYVSLAVVDAKFLVTSWVHVFDRRSGKAFEHVRKAPPGRFRAPANLLDDAAEFKARGYRVALHNNLEQEVHRVRVGAEEAGDRLQVRMSLVLHETQDRTQPLVALLPLGPDRPFFTHKSACPVSGMLNIGGEEVELRPDRDVALLDFHKAFYPRSTFWRWATFAMQDPRGNILGVNLTHNVIEDDAELNENCIWHGNRISLVGAARFEVPGDPMREWRIRTLDGRVDLALAPQGLRRERINLGFARSAYDQPYGLYSGHVVEDAGHLHEVRGAFGVAEDHSVTW